MAPSDIEATIGDTIAQPDAVGIYEYLLIVLDRIEKWGRTDFHHATQRETQGGDLEQYIDELSRFMHSAHESGMKGLHHSGEWLISSVSNWIEEKRHIGTLELTALKEFPVLGRNYLDSAGSEASIEAIIEHLRHPIWDRPLFEDDVERLRRNLAWPPVHSASHDDDTRSIDDDSVPTDTADIIDGPNTFTSHVPENNALFSALPADDHGTNTGEHDLLDSTSLSSEHIAFEQLDAYPDASSMDQNCTTSDNVAVADTASPSDAPIIEDDPDLHTVNSDYVALFATEFASLYDSLSEILDGAHAVNGEERSALLLEYSQELEHLGNAAHAVDLNALIEFFALLQLEILASAAEPHNTDDWFAAMEEWPLLVHSYLTIPNDHDLCTALAEFMARPLWHAPIDAEEAARIATALASIRLVTVAPSVEPRQTLANPDDVSLDLPDDVNQDLLNELLNELPVQTEAFSSAIQRIASGNGSLTDIDIAKRAAHTLKGAGNTVGIRGIANLTHHMEDILIAFSAHQLLPTGTLANMLSDAADCLESMSEYLAGIGPHPTDATRTMQQILDCANRIDQEGVYELRISTTTPIAALNEFSPSQANTETVVQAKEQATERVELPSTPTLRVPAEIIDEQLRLVGETIISTTQVQEQLSRITQQFAGLQRQNVAFSQLAFELENLVDIRGIGPVSRANNVSDDFDPLEMEHYSEIHTVSRRLMEAATDAKEMAAFINDHIGALRELLESQRRLHAESQNAVMRTRMIPVQSIAQRLHRSVRQTCRLLDKRTELHIHGTDILIDSNILNSLIDPLMHVLRNAIDHGIEPPEERIALGKPEEGSIDLIFSREGEHIVVRCRDDGMGLDYSAIRGKAVELRLVEKDAPVTDTELAHLILLPGFTTRDQSTQVSGRGIGMDVLNSHIRSLKGSLRLMSEPGHGMLVEIRIPASLISTHALLAMVRDKVIAISSHGIIDIHYVSPGELSRLGEKITYMHGDDLIELREFEQLLDLPADRRERDREGYPVLIVQQDNGATHAIRLQKLIDSRDVVVKGLGKYVPKFAGLVGGTILGDGSVAPVIDLPEIIRTQAHGDSSGYAKDHLADQRQSAARTPSLRSALVVDDSLSARRAAAQFLKDAGFDVRTAIDGMEAVAVLEKFVPDIILVDLEMPRMNGFELTAHVRANVRTTAIPVIMVTSRSTEKHRKQAASAGVNEYMVKPFNDDEMLRQINKLIGVTA